MSTEFTTRQSGEVTIVDVEGSVTIGKDAIGLGNTLRELAKSGHKKVLLNLAGVSYMDSAGIGEMVSGLTTIAHHGGVMKLVNLTKNVQTLMKITHLNSIFQTYDEEAKALASFGSA